MLAGKRKYHFLVAAIIVLLDRVSKWLVATNISLHDSLSVVPGFFRITHVENPGAAFGLFSDASPTLTIAMLVVFSVVALLVIGLLLWKNSLAMNMTGVGLSLILGGAIGNLWDRLLTGHVVDFLDFFVDGYHWPAFNVADSAIVIGAVMLIAEILFAKQPARERSHALNRHTL